jgi:MoxR-like ATPase
MLRGDGTMKQKSEPKNSTAKQKDGGVDWKALEDSLAKKSQEVTSERINRPAPAHIEQKLAEIVARKVDPDFVKNWTDFGMKPLEARAKELDLSPDMLALRRLQEGDAIEGLAARAHRTTRKSDLRAVRVELLKDKDVPVATRDKKLTEISQQLVASDQAYEAALQTSPEKFLAAHSADLNHYRRQYERGRIIQTPYVLEKKGEVITNLANNRMVFISGETGTGKTELARICAKEVTGQEALVVRGYVGMSPAEMYGSKALTDSAEVRFENIQKEIDQALDAYKQRFPEASQADEAEVVKGVLTKSGVTTTRYMLGAVYEAAETGKVVIIDEANFIPQEVLASLNDIMTKKPGEPIAVQQDGTRKIVVKEGFGIIFTGNLNPPEGPTKGRYIGRKEFDAAFVDRVPDVEYSRLPMEVQGVAADYGFEAKQLYLLAVVTSLIPPMTTEGGTLEKIENRYGSMYLPGGADRGLDLLWRFTQFVAVTQKAFHGEILDGDPHGFTSAGGNQAGITTKVQLSNRGMMRVIGAWRDDGFQYELDHYIAKDLFSRAKDPREKAFFYQIGQKFGFFKTEGWEQNPNYSSNGLSRFSVEIPVKRGKEGELVPNESPPRELISAREVIESLFGEIPQRNVWPEGTITEAQEDQQYESHLARIYEELEKWDDTNKPHVDACIETQNLIDTKKKA